jgi:hypothetical protein
MHRALSSPRILPSGRTITCRFNLLLISHDLVQNIMTWC